MPKYVPRRNRLKKRWYVKAGANLPFIGRTNIAFGTNKTKRNLVSMVRSRLEEPLHKLNNAGTGILHNTVYSLNVTGNIPQGTSDNSRSGDTIHLDALKFTVAFTSRDASNPNPTKHYRFMIIKQDTDLYTGSDAWGSSLGSTAIFQNVGGALVLAKNNAKVCTILYDKTVSITPSIASTTTTVIFSDILRLQQKFVFKTGTNYGKHSNIYLVVVGLEYGATTGTTVLGNVDMTSDLIFKDSK